ncbi:hypothetical protein [Candidatus Cyanaurora vandensis]|uniref:hypothetical protein n=1 Tax=Candidatus Cyanaurora vandensis TaxID=2714958 RepID=UPI00257BB3C6|nr:hypothetical protein [Candidatus Cyanaurora vandensis]
MFFPGSRYLNCLTYTVTLPDGTVVKAVQPPLPRPRPLLGYHRRQEGQRLDLIANRYLGDPLAFWQLCDSNNTLLPDSLAARALVGIPRRS